MQASYRLQSSFFWRMSQRSAVEIEGERIKDV
jgi:hypothetical protein